MTPAQIDLLKRCIEADRSWRSHKEVGDYITQDARGVEVGAINGINPRTAQSLIDAGLLDAMDLHGHTYVFLGSTLPYDDVTVRLDG